MKDKHKLFISILALTAMNSSFATGVGFYLGMQMGQSDVHNTPAVYTYPGGGTITVTPNSKGLGVRALAGYNFRPWLGAEAGFARYSSAYYNFPDGECRNPPYYIFDGTIKASVPIWVVSIYAKGGVAAVRASGFANIFSSDAKSGTRCEGGQANFWAAAPIYGAGISYDMTPNWVFDVSWTRINKTRRSTVLDFKSIGVSYHWVPVYCGQFLC